MAFDLQTGKALRPLEENAYLTYVTQTGPYIVTQYITADGYFFGLLLNGRAETIAYLPYLSDVFGGRLIFNYPTGHVRQSRVFTLRELVEIAHERIK
jgi:hypothetical protein